MLIYYLLKKRKERKNKLLDDYFKELIKGE